MKVRRIANIISFVLAFQISFAQPKDYYEIDQHALTASSSVTKSLESLTRYLAKPASNDLEKVRSFYVWITNNISYDTKAFFSGSQKQYTSDEVLNRKKAVCQGYSVLLKEMCNLENIQCEMIPGYSKGYGYNSSKPLNNTDHAWNAVKIDNTWYLIDATWGSGYLNQNDRFEKHFSNEFFLSDPSTFIYKHLPADPMWQLLGSTVSFDVFQSDTIKIKEYLSSAEKNYSFKDSLNNYENLSDTDKQLKSAFNEFSFNNKLSAPVGYAIMNIAFTIFNELLKDQDINPKDAYNKQKEILDLYENALHYFMLNNDQNSMQARRVCRDNIKSCKDNLEVYQQMMQNRNR